MTERSRELTARIAQRFADAKAAVPSDEEIAEDLNARLRRALRPPLPPATDDPTPEQYATWSREQREAHHDRIVEQRQQRPPEPEQQQPPPGGAGDAATHGDQQPEPTRAFSDRVRADARAHHKTVIRERS